MIDNREASIGTIFCRHRLELDLPDLGEFATRIEEIEQASAHAADGGDFKLARTDLLPERRIAQLLGAVEGGRRAINHEPDGANGWAMRNVMRVRETFFFLVDDKVDRPLRPAGYRFRFVARGVAKPEAGQKSRELIRAAIIDRKFNEFDAETFRPRRHLRNVGNCSSAPAAQMGQEIDERALALDRDRPRGAGAKLVVENLQRKIAGVAGCLDRCHEIEQRQIALPRKAAEMPAPIQDVHLQPRSVRQLNEKNAIARDRLQRLKVRLAGVSMKAVGKKPAGGGGGASHDFPGIAIIVDVTSPGERLEANAQAALRCSFAKLVKIRRAAVYAAHGVRRHVAADQQRIAR